MPRVARRVSQHPFCGVPVHVSTRPNSDTSLSTCTGAAGSNSFKGPGDKSDWLQVGSGLKYKKKGKDGKNLIFKAKEEEIHLSTLGGGSRKIADREKPKQKKFIAQNATPKEAKKKQL